MGQHALPVMVVVRRALEQVRVRVQAVLMESSFLETPALNVIALVKHAQQQVPVLVHPVPIP